MSKFQFDYDTFYNYYTNDDNIKTKDMSPKEIWFYRHSYSEDTNRNDRDISLHSGNEFKTVLSILEHIDDVKNNYKLIDCELKSPNNTKFIKLQRKIYPIPTDKNCSVCYEPTTEYTVCKHPICFRCRHTCIMSNNLVCPICRDGELRVFPTELSYEDENFVW